MRVTSFTLAALLSACGDDAGDVSGENCSVAYYADVDQDLHGDPTTWTTGCAAPAGYVVLADDCDDRVADVHPGADELCNAVDDDCDGDINADALDAGVWFADRDGDGFGDDADAVAQCDAPVGRVAVGGDCDDADALVRPDALEVCNDVDDDCDERIDDDDELMDAEPWYADTDGDGYGNALESSVACTLPSGMVADASDCDDTNANVHPVTAELCDEIDNDCDGLVDDEDPDPRVGATAFPVDADGDGFGDDALTTRACVLGPGMATTADDCDDHDAAVGAPATYYWDRDGDGYGDEISDVVTCSPRRDYITGPIGDCDDWNETRFPDAPETCDGEDDNCDGLVDADDPLVVLDSWFADADGDGFGDAAAVTLSCDRVAGSVRSSSDCDDGDASVNTDAVEACDGIDNDCTSVADDGVVYLDWYADADGDGFGDASVSSNDCVQPDGFVLSDADCDDSDAGSHPGAFDPYGDDIDQDCNAVADDPVLQTNGADVTIVGDSSRNSVGSKLAVGDLDGDGSADLLLGMWLASDDFGGSDADGQASIAYGPVTGQTAVRTLPRMTPRLDNSGFGAFVTVGDADGDGLDDAFVTSYRAGMVYAFLGPITGDTTTDDADATFTSAANGLGYEAALVPDVDGDGVADLVLPVSNVPCDDPSTSGDDYICGQVYVTSAGSTGHVAPADATYRYDSETAYEWLGLGVGSIGDSTGDGLTDLALGASGSDAIHLVEGGGAPGAYVVSDVAWADITSGTVGDDAFIHATMAGGDLDDDGYSDLVVGAPYFDGGAGAVFAFSGPVTGGVAMDRARAVWSRASGQCLGGAVTTGDVDGDGAADLLFGADWSICIDETNAAYLQVGKAAGTIDVATLPSFTRDNDWLSVGSAVAIVPDWTEDGWAEIAIGVPYATNGAGDRNGMVALFLSEQWLP